MKSKTKINKSASRKHLELKKIIEKLKKHHIEVADLLARPRSKQIKANLEELDKKTKEGEVVIVPGKVLGNGELNKKLTIIALAFSESARKKLKGCDLITLQEFTEKKPSFRNIKIIK